MSVSVTMPQLGESVTEGTVTRWLKQEGEQVQADEPLLEVSTDKVDTEIPSPASGTLASITVGEDETVEVGAELATIDDGSGGGETAQQEQPPQESGQQESGQQESGQQESGQQDEPAPPESTPAQQEPAAQEPAPQEPAPEPEAAPQDAPQQEAPAAQDERPQQQSRPEPTQAVAAEQPSEPGAGGTDGSGDDGDGGAYVTPLVRKLATEHDVDLAALTGTGVGGRIRKQDVLDAARAQQAAAAEPAAETPQQAAAAPAQPAPATAQLRGRTEKLTRLRALIARRMVESLQTSAQLTTVVEVDVTKIARLRTRAKEDFAQREGVKLSFLPFFALATVEALKAHPNVNASIDTEAGTVTYHDAENLGVAVDTERGLVVPVIKDAGDLNIGGLARKIADLADRTRTNNITPDELGGGTFTLTNTGSRGALFDTPIINQPQVAILGTGAVVKRAVVVDDPNLGEIVTVRSMVYLALTYDHRIVDGADAARFLSTVKERLEGGDFEAQLGL